MEEVEDILKVLEHGLIQGEGFAEPSHELLDRLSQEPLGDCISLEVYVVKQELSVLYNPRIAHSYLLSGLR
jgi:hypothetical protein